MGWFKGGKVGVEWLGGGILCGLNGVNRELELCASVLQYTSTLLKSFAFYLLNFLKLPLRVKLNNFSVS